MVSRQEQARWHGDRYFGGATTLTLTRPASGIVTRNLHPEESRHYSITVTGSTTGVAVVYLPNALHLPLGGPVVTIWNESTSNGVLFVSNGSVGIITLSAGYSSQLYLLENNTAAGTWIGSTSSAGVGVLTGPRTHLT